MSNTVLKVVVDKATGNILHGGYIDFAKQKWFNPVTMEVRVDQPTPFYIKGMFNGVTDPLNEEFDRYHSWDNKTAQWITVPN